MSITTTRPLTKLPAPGDVARAFCQILNRDLSKADLRQIIAMNREYARAGDGSVCATHEFLDPNESMLEAFEQFSIRAASQRFMDHHNDLWTLAWDMSKAAEFDADRVVVVDVNMGGWRNS